MTAHSKQLLFELSNKLAIFGYDNLSPPSPPGLP